MLIVLAGAPAQVVSAASKGRLSDCVVYMGPVETEASTMISDRSFPAIPDRELPFFIDSADPTRGDWLQQLAGRNALPLHTLPLEFADDFLGFPSPGGVRGSRKELLQVFSSIFKDAVGKDELAIDVAAANAPTPVAELVGFLALRLGALRVKIRTYYEAGLPPYSRVNSFELPLGRAGHRLVEPDAVFSVLFYYLVDQSTEIGSLKRLQGSSAIADILTRHPSLSDVVPPIRSGGRGHPGWAKRFRLVSRELAYDGLLQERILVPHREVYSISDLGRSCLQLCFTIKDYLPKPCADVLDSVPEMKEAVKHALL